MQFPFLSIRSFTEWTTRHARQVVAAGAVTLVGCLVSIGRFAIVQDMDATLPQAHPYVLTTKEIEKTFNRRHSLVLELRSRSSSVLTAEAVGILGRLTDAFRRAEGIYPDSLVSLTAPAVKAIARDGDAVKFESFVDDEAEGAPPAQFGATLKHKLLENDQYKNILYASDFRSLYLLADFRDDHTGFKHIEARARAIVAAEASANFDIRLAGQPIFLAALERYSSRMDFLFPLAVLVIGLLHWEAFRTLQGLLLPLVTGLGAVIISTAVLARLSGGIDAFSSAAPILIFAIAAGHAVQILTRYCEKCRDAFDATPTQAPTSAALIVETLVEVGPIMLAVGLIAILSFLSLTVFELRTIRIFGAYVSIGVACAVALEFTLVPAIRALLPAMPPARGALPSRWENYGAWFADTITGRPATLCTLAALAAAILIAGCFKVQTGNSIRSYFSERVPTVVDDRLVNQGFAGANTFYVRFKTGAADGGMKPVLIEAMERVKREVCANPAAGACSSILDFIVPIKRAMGECTTRQACLPHTSDEAEQLLLLFSSAVEPGVLDRWITPDHAEALLVVLLKSDDYLLVKRLDSAVRAATKDYGIDVGIGGSAASDAALSERLVEGKLKNIGVILLVTLVSACVIFRSLATGVIVTVPLIFTVTGVFGVMGWWGLHLNTVTATICALAAGVGCDFAAYFAYRFFHERRRGLDAESALRNAYAGAGRAVMYVATAVIGGYAVMCASMDFKVHVWFGVLICASIAISALTSLSVLPALLFWSARWHARGQLRVTNVS